jgi:hypothetical protein
MSRDMTALVNLLQQPIAEAQMAFLTFDAAVFPVEWQVFLVDPIAAWLAHISI